MAVNKQIEHLQINNLKQHLKDREAEIELLQKTFSAVGNELDLEKVFQIVAEHARELIQAETLLIPIIDSNCDSYTYRGGSGANATEIIGESLPIDYGICGWAWKHKRAWWRGVLDELSEEERNLWEKQAGSVILVPLQGKKHFLGGIAGINKIGGDEFTRRDLNLLSLFASIVPIAIENAMAVQQIEDAKRLTDIYQMRLERQNNELIESSRELEYLSLYDSITGLPNRSLFHDRLNQNLTSAAKNNTQLGLLLVDIDNFKRINENIGHDRGDFLLHLIAQRLLDLIDPDETLSRLGGDEFILIFPNHDAEQTLARGHALLKHLEKQFEVYDNKIAVSASIGAVVYPQNGNDISLLLQHADQAMYSAKQNHSGICIYNPEISTASPAHLTLLADLRNAIDKQQFELRFQPKVTIPERQLIGAEILGYWEHPVRGVIPAHIFINDLEETGLINKYTYWLIERAIKYLSDWSSIIGNIQLAINLSTQTLMNNEFRAFLDATILSQSIGEQLIFEITENLFLSEYDHLSDTLKHIRNLGITLSIDDFGTGYSSLSRLKRLPVSELKIDRSFIMDMGKNLDDEVIVHSTIELAHNLGLKVTAEGIESEAIFSHLNELNCDIAQGFYISKALDDADFEQLLKQPELLKKT
ncbi:MAG: EAL domain-containing protein [Gammaproteobacteria bacterium]|nr:EAL domain-containing protein [Gammaproteobacteria bacterium]